MTVGRIRLWLMVIAVLIAAWVLFRPYVIVPAGHKAVLFSLQSGVLEGQLGEGFHFIVPIVHHPFLYDVRTQTYSMSKTHWEGEVKGDDSLSALTEDGQTVSVDISVRFRLDPNNLWRLHKEVGPDYIGKIIRPEVRSHTRIVIAQYPVTDVYSRKRQAIEDEIAARLTRSLSRNYIIVDEVLLRDIRFSDAFQKAVIDKQIAQQNAQRMKYVLEKTEKEKQQKIIEAEGEAKAIELKGQALAANPQVIRYEYVRKIAPNVRAVITNGKDIAVDLLSPTHP